MSETKNIKPQDPAAITPEAAHTSTAASTHRTTAYSRIGRKSARKTSLGRIS